MNKEILRKLQLTQLEIAKEIKRVCEQNSIRYWIDSGTLLGAVRHKGFIPWDDDMDMGMMRSDYEKFIRIAPECLSEKYELVYWENNEFYPHQFAKVVKRGTIYQEEAHLKHWNNGIFVDIFPYDVYPNIEKLRKKQGFYLTMLRGIIRVKCGHSTWYADGKFHLKRWITNLPYRFFSIFHTKQYFIKKYNYYATMYDTEKQIKNFFPQGISKYGKWIIPADVFEEYSKEKFEDTEFSIPKGYDIYLKCAYGDYMQLPPDTERENRHSLKKLDFGDEY